MRATPELLERVARGEEDLVSLLAGDLELYAEMALKIQTKAGTIINFVFNDAQQVLHKWCEDTLAEDGRIRCVLLKARQYGGTTYIASRLFRNAAMRFNQHLKVIAQDEYHAKKLLGMYQLYYNMLPDELRPKKKYQSKSELFFANGDGRPEAVKRDPGLNSSLGVYSAGSKSAGRSATLRGLHCSEVAFWPGADVPKFMLGLLNTVPTTGDAAPGTEIFLESTANGMGNYFHQKYMRAKGRDDEGGFRALFIPWYLHHEYREKTPHNFQESLNPLERELFDKEHPGWDYVNPATGKKTLSLEQLFWRRVAIATLCDGDLRQFAQEYPLSDEEAFVTSGQSYFPLDKIMEAEKGRMLKDPVVFRGEIEEVEDKEAAKKKKGATKIVLLEDLLGGRFEIYEKPGKEDRYGIFADVAEGVAGGDLSVVSVVNLKTGNQAAEWSGLIAPDELGDVFYAIGKYYNWARGAPESQAQGLVTLMRIKELKYPFIYRRQVYDDETQRFKDQEGWVTTKRTRPVMLEALRGAFRDGDYIPHSSRLLAEMKTFVLLRGKLQAMDGAHDDHVMASAGVCRMREELPRPGIKRAKSWLANDGDERVEYQRAQPRREKHKPQYDRFTGALIG